MPFSLFECLALVCDTGCLVLIWLVQRVIYPSFQFYNYQQLQQWHKKYTGLVTWIVLPLMVGQLVFAIRIVITYPYGIAIAKLLLVLGTWVMTFVIFVPLHRALETAIEQQVIVKKLVRKNWSRTIVWTLIFGLDLIRLFSAN
ncbi:MAG: hypothetical protein AAGF96_02685 [Bacteroidota bacterium]